MSSEAVQIPGARAVPVLKRGDRREDDLVVIEEPLEIRVDGKPLVVTMRTPGHDTELAAGFLHAEGLIAGGRNVASIQAVAGTPDVGNQIKVTAFAGDHVDVVLADLADGSATVDTNSAERTFRATAACGVCGKEEIADLAQDLPPVSPVPVGPELLQVLPDKLRQAQQLFEATGGIHAAGVFDLNGCVRPRRHRPTPPQSDLHRAERRGPARRGSSSSAGGPAARAEGAKRCR